MSLHIRIEGDGSSRVVRLSGECDMASAPELHETLKALGPPDVLRVTLDLSHLDFLDSTGLGVCVSALKRLRTAGGDLELAGVPPSIRRILAVTGLDKIVPTTDRRP